MKIYHLWIHFINMISKHKSQPIEYLQYGLNFPKNHLVISTKSRKITSLEDRWFESHPTSPYRLPSHHIEACRMRWNPTTQNHLAGSRLWWKPSISAYIDPYRLPSQHIEACRMRWKPTTQNQLAGPIGCDGSHPYQPT